MRKFIPIAIVAALISQSASFSAFDCPDGASGSGIKTATVSADSPYLKAHHCAGGKKAAQIQSTAVDVGTKRENADGFRAKLSGLALSTAQESQDAPHGLTDSSPPKLYAHSPPFFILHSSLLI